MIVPKRKKWNENESIYNNCIKTQNKKKIPFSLYQQKSSSSSSSSEENLYVFFLVAARLPPRSRAGSGAAGLSVGLKDISLPSKSSSLSPDRRFAFFAGWNSVWIEIKVNKTIIIQVKTLFHSRNIALFTTDIIHPIKAHELDQVF